MSFDFLILGLGRHNTGFLTNLGLRHLNNETVNSTSHNINQRTTSNNRTTSKAPKSIKVRVSPAATKKPAINSASADIKAKMASAIAVTIENNPSSKVHNP